MNFFKKRGTAWFLFVVTIIFSYFVGQAKRPADKIEILPGGVYVQDNANVLSASTEDYMTQLNNGLVSKVGAEIQVVTINTTGGEDIFDVAINHGVNTNLSENSCVFLIAVEDIDAVIVQGEGLIYAFPDDELSDILQENFTVQEFKNRKLDDCAQKAFAELIELYEDYYNVRITGSSHIEYNEPQSIDFDTLVIIAFFILILVLIAVVSAPRKRRTVFVPGHTAGRTVVPPRTTVHTTRSHTPPRNNGGFGSSSRGGSFSSSRSGGFGSSSRGGSFSSSSRGGSFSSGSRSGGFRK